MPTMPPWAAQFSLSKCTNIASCAVSCCIAFPYLSVDPARSAVPVDDMGDAHGCGQDSALARGVGVPEQFGSGGDAGLGDRLGPAVFADSVRAAEARPDAGLL